MIDIDMSKIKPYDRSVYYYETDRMQIVHHSNYIRWIEEARLDWMTQIGWDYKSVEDDGYIIPVLGVTAEYKSMCHFGDDVLIHVSLSEYTGVRVGFSYEIGKKRQPAVPPAETPETFPEKILVFGRNSLLLQEKGSIIMQSGNSSTQQGSGTKKFRKEVDR